MLKSLLIAIARRLSRLEQLNVDNQALRERALYLQEYSASLRSKKNDALAWLEITSQWVDTRKASYTGDGMMLLGRAAYFLDDPKFQEAYKFGIGLPGHETADPHAEWRVAVVCWAAWHAKQIDGDFVACGGGTSPATWVRSASRYVDLNATGKRFFLFDTEAAADNFAEFPKVQPIRGTIPGMLSSVAIDKISYLSIFSNLPPVEIIEYFWPKLASGAVVIFGDYGFGSDERLRLDACVAQWGLKILLLPTGQGLLLKP